jgi:hypothetical protein
MVVGVLVRHYFCYHFRLHQHRHQDLWVNHSTVWSYSPLQQRQTIAIVGASSLSDKKEDEEDGVMAMVEMQLVKMMTVETTWKHVRRIQQRAT